MRKNDYSFLQEMDIPTQPTPERDHGGMCRFLHASEESRRRLEAVSLRKSLKGETLTWRSKIKAIDFFGAGLALGGSSVLVVRTRNDVLTELSC